MSSSIARSWKIKQPSLSPRIYACTRVFTMTIESPISARSQAADTQPILPTYSHRANNEKVSGLSSGSAIVFDVASANFPFKAAAKNDEALRRSSLGKCHVLLRDPVPTIIVMGSDVSLWNDQTDSNVPIVAQCEIQLTYQALLRS